MWRMSAPQGVLGRKVILAVYVKKFPQIFYEYLVKDDFNTNVFIID